MEDRNLVNELIDMFIKIKNTTFHNIIECEKLTHNEKLVLFIVHDTSVDGKISLSELRKRLNLAPSTVTPIITSLENMGLIERNIDKADRRNIFLQLSSDGIEFTKASHQKMTQNVKDYINYMGEEDIKELIRLLTKTSIFLEERRRK